MYNKSNTIKTFLLVLLVFVTFNSFACSTPNVEANGVVPERKESTVVESVENRSEPDICSEWKAAEASLPEEGIKLLKEHKIVFVSGAAAGSFYLIDEEVIVNCNTRIKVGYFLWKVQLGTATKADKLFASQHSADIVRVLRMVWDSREFSGDGTHHEKYNLVGYAGLRDQDTFLLLTDLIQRKAMNLGLLVSIIEKPMRSLRPAIIQSLRETEDTAQQICYLVALEQISPSTSNLQRLHNISVNRQLDTKTKDAVSRIVRKFKSGKKITGPDLQDLPILEHEEEKIPKSGVTKSGVTPA